MIGLLCGVLAVAPQAASAVPAGFQDSWVASLPQPMDMDWTPDGRMLVTTRAGKLRVITGNAVAATPAIDFSASICTSVEEGLAGVVVDPDFALNNYIYLYRSYPKFGPCGSVEPVNRLSRFVLPPTNIIDPASEVVLFDTAQVGYGNHNGGDHEFGPDGYLYVTVGENQLGWAEDLGRLQGRVLRITASGAIPPGNPYTGAGSARCHLDGVPPVGSPPGTRCREIFATGLRHPFKFVLDPESPTTRFFVNDVGGEFWEEIDVLTEPGTDFGWPTREGP